MNSQAKATYSWLQRFSFDWLLTAYKWGYRIMSNQKISIVYTTIATIKEAEILAEQAVVEKYAACVNIIPGAISVYEWEGKLEKNQECLVIFKTITTKAEELKQWILEKHPYSVPALLSGTLDSSCDFYTYVQSKTCDTMTPLYSD